MIPEGAVEAAWEQARSDSDGYPFPEREEIRRLLEATAPHMLAEAARMIEADQWQLGRWGTYSEGYEDARRQSARILRGEAKIPRG